MTSSTDSTRETWTAAIQPFWDFVAAAKKRGLCAFSRARESAEAFEE